MAGRSGQRAHRALKISPIDDSRDPAAAGCSGGQFVGGELSVQDAQLVDAKTSPRLAAAERAIVGAGRQRIFAKRLLDAADDATAVGCAEAA